MNLAQEMRKMVKEYRKNTNVCFMDGVYNKILDCAFHGRSNLKLNISNYGDILPPIMCNKLKENGFKVDMSNSVITISW